MRLPDDVSRKTLDPRAEAVSGYSRGFLILVNDFRDLDGFPRQPCEVWCVLAHLPHGPGDLPVHGAGGEDLAQASTLKVVDEPTQPLAGELLLFGSGRRASADLE